MPKHGSVGSIEADSPEIARAFEKSGRRIIEMFEPLGVRSETGEEIAPNDFGFIKVPFINNDGTNSTATNRTAVRVLLWTPGRERASRLEFPQPLLDFDLQFTGVVGTSIDSEEQLRRSMKYQILATKGVIARLISNSVEHDTRIRDIDEGAPWVKGPTKMDRPPQSLTDVTDFIHQAVDSVVTFLPSS